MSLPAETSKAPNPSNVIAITAAVIGPASSIMSGTFGFNHAKALWDSAKGATADMEQYIEVGTAFWDALSIAAAFAFVAGLLVYEIQTSAGA